MNPEKLVVLGCLTILAIFMARLNGLLSLRHAIAGIGIVIYCYIPPATATEPASLQAPQEQQVLVVNDLMCGLHRVQVNDYAGLMIDSQPYGDYKTTMLDDQSNYVHQFGDKAELRVTQMGRIAFRLAGETRWASCKPLVFYRE